MTDWEIFVYIFSYVGIIFLAGSISWFVGYLINLWRDDNEE